MRIIIYKRVALFTLIFGFISGILAVIFSNREITDMYGSWIMSFYNCEEAELWLKAVFSGPFFVFAAFALGLFVFGYLFVYPVVFYYSYTFGFLLTCAVFCFGKESFLPILMKLPTFFAACFFLCFEAALAVKFSSENFSGLEYKTLRVKTSQYLVQGLGYVIFCVLITVLEVFLCLKF